MPAEIVVIGSLNMDLVVRAPRAPAGGETIQGSSFRFVPGGKGANQAVAASRLGARVAMVGRVGEDTFGDSLLKGLRRDAVAVDHVRTDSGASTGIALITVDDAGQNRIVVVPGANGRVDRTDVDAAEPLLALARFVLLQLEIPLDTVAHAINVAQRNGVPVILNPAPARPLPAEVLSRVSILVPNETEAGILAGVKVIDLPSAMAAGRDLLARGPQVVIVTLGEKGALLVTQGGCDHIPAPRVPVVDTTAAGDAFVGGLAVGLVRGLPLQEAVRSGVTAGSMAVTRAGAQTSLPTSAELERGVTTDLSPKAARQR